MNKQFEPEEIECKCGHCGHKFRAVPEPKHKVLCGDSTKPEDVARLMGGEKARLIVTSPPYNQNIETFKPSGMQKEAPSFVNRMSESYFDSLPEPEYQKQQVEMFTMMKAFLTKDASVFYNHKIRYRDKCVVSPYEWIVKMPYKLRQEIIWDRGASITLNARMFIPADERIYWMRAGNDFIFNDEIEIKSWSSVWELGATNEVRISAAFATEIPIRCIRAASNPNDTVLEPFLGSGTTLIAAERTNRKCYGIEISPKYVDVILSRYEAETGDTPELLERL